MKNNIKAFALCGLFALSSAPLYCPTNQRSSTINTNLSLKKVGVALGCFLATGITTYMLTDKIVLSGILSALSTPTIIQLVTSTKTAVAATWLEHARKKLAAKRKQAEQEYKKAKVAYQREVAADKQAHPTEYAKADQEYKEECRRLRCEVQTETTAKKLKWVADDHQATNLDIHEIRWTFEGIKETAKALRQKTYASIQARNKTLLAAEKTYEKRMAILNALY